MIGFTPHIRRALDWLKEQRLPDGYWSDFLTYAGTSTEWITGYVGCVFAMQTDPQDHRIATEAWAWLNDDPFWRRRHGWGYHSGVPVDADSTLWALTLADALQTTTAKGTRGYNYLAACLQDDGGLTTYATEKPIRRFTKLPPMIRFDGWCQSHACVTAAAAQLTQFVGHHRLLDYLRKTQTHFGAWISYWWFHHEYTTALAAEALSQTDDPQDAERVQQAIDWALYMSGRHWERQPEERSVFGTAYRLRILACQPERPDVQAELERSAAWLVSQQNEEGCWSSYARMRIPPPDVTDPQQFHQWTVDGKGGASIVRDQNAIFTTTTAAMALCKLRQMSMRP